jgi:hypothetical protein
MSPKSALRFWDNDMDEEKACRQRHAEDNELSRLNLFLSDTVQRLGTETEKQCGGSLK